MILVVVIFSTLALALALSLHPPFPPKGMLVFYMISLKIYFTGTLLERFSIECLEPKPKLSLKSITKDTDNTGNPLKLSYNQLHVTETKRRKTSASKS